MSINTKKMKSNIYENVILHGIDLTGYGAQNAAAEQPWRCGRSSDMCWLGML